MAYASKRGELTELEIEVQGYTAHPDVNYEAYGASNPERVYSDVNLDMSERGIYRARASYQRFIDFTKWVDGRGGVARYLHSTQTDILKLDPGEPPNGGLYATDLEGRKLPFNYVEKCHACSRWQKYIQFPALLETIRAWNGYDHPHDWILNRIATGASYSEIAKALGTSLTTIITWVTVNVDPAHLKAAWKTRTELMVDAADKLYEDAVTADFSTECGRDQAESRAKVLAATSGHLKLQAVSRHENYQPKSSQIAITPGSITISLAAPE